MSKELKAYSPYANRDGDVCLYHQGETDMLLDDEDKVYLKEDVDALLAEKDEEIESLKRELEDVTCANSINCEAVRRLRRALYKVCAKWAFLAQWERGALVENWEKWENMERKCGAKAKEYK